MEQDPQEPKQAEEVDDKQKQFGFEREEMFKDPLVGTVKPYDAHVLAFVSKPVETWPKGVESEEFSPLVFALSNEMKAKKGSNFPNCQVRLSAAEAGDGTKEGDVLIFPHAIRASGLTSENASRFWDEVFPAGAMGLLTDGLPQTGDGSGLVYEKVQEAAHVFVCAHGNHDQRCGVCGPPLIRLLREGTTAKGLNVRIHAISHIGGHKYAGNMIVFAPTPASTNTEQAQGHWYGYVTPMDVPLLLDAIEKGHILTSRWRGAMGLDGDGQKAFYQKCCGGACANGTASDPASGAEKLQMPATLLSRAAASASLYLRPWTWEPRTRVAAAAAGAAAVALVAAWSLRRQRQS